MLDILLNEDVDICDKQAFDIMYRYLENINIYGRYALHEEEKYGLKISVGMFPLVRVVRGYITNLKILIYFHLTDRPNTRSEIRIADYDEIYATLFDNAYRISYHVIINSNEVTSMKLSSLICKNIKSARNF